VPVHAQDSCLGAPGSGEWHLLEIGFFNGVVSVYLDEELKVEWSDLVPWEGGTMNLEPYTVTDSLFPYDDFSICELTAPLQTIIETPE